MTPSGSRVFQVRTPSRKAVIKQNARRCYHAIAATKSAPTSNCIRIKREMNKLATVQGCRQGGSRGFERTPFSEGPLSTSTACVAGY